MHLRQSTKVQIALIDSERKKVNTALTDEHIYENECWQSGHTEEQSISGEEMLELARGYLKETLFNAGAIYDQAPLCAAVYWKI